MSKAEERSKEIIQAALDYANNLDDVKPTDEFRRNLCISLGQAFMKGAEWADSHQAEKDLTDKAKTSSGWDGFFYGQGYKQAEKDNELTWKDVKAIFLLVQVEWSPNKNEEEIYQEVLKRFKTTKD